MAATFVLPSNQWHVKYEFDSTYPIVGWRITQVEPGATGAFLGFQPGDTIVQVGQIRYDPASPVALDVVLNMAVAAGHRYIVVKDRNSPAYTTANF